MKKLMVALAAVALAMGVNAASVDWNLGIAGSGEAWANAGAYMLAFNGADYTTVINGYTVDGKDMSSYAISGAEAIKNAKGTAKLTNGTIQTENAPDSMFWVIFTQGNADAGSAIQWTAATDVKGAQYTPPATGTPFALAASNFANTGTVASVPEPTSALLLVLGMAGLALKRKRA